VPYFHSKFFGPTCRNDRLLARKRQEKARKDEPERYATTQFREFDLVHSYDENGIMLYELDGINMEAFQMAVRYFCFVRPKGNVEHLICILQFRWLLFSIKMKLRVSV